MQFNISKEKIKEAIEFIRLYYPEIEDKDEEIEKYLKLASVEVCENRYTPNNYIKAVSAFALHLLYQTKERQIDNTFNPDKDVINEKINDVSITYSKRETVGQAKKKAEDVYHYNFLNVPTCFIKGSFVQLKDDLRDRHNCYSDTDFSQKNWDNL